jgi:hypothetical protein
MNKQETASMLAYLCSAFPQVTIRKENAEMYHRFLEDLEFSDVQKALDVLIMESKWFPSVAQIREAVGQVTGEFGPPLGVAWAEVMGLASSVGSYRRPEFSHSAIQDAVDKIGWRNVCMGDVNSMRIQFSQVYQRRQGSLPQLGTVKRLELNENF